MQLRSGLAVYSIQHPPTDHEHPHICVCTLYTAYSTHIYVCTLCTVSKREWPPFVVQKKNPRLVTITLIAIFASPKSTAVAPSWTPRLHPVPPTRAPTTPQQHSSLPAIQQPDCLGFSTCCSGWLAGCLIHAGQTLPPYRVQDGEEVLCRTLPSVAHNATHKSDWTLRSGEAPHPVLCA